MPAIAPDEVEWTAVRAQGAGGQNVNKVASAVHLRFDVPRSSLPEPVKERLLALGGAKVTTDGVLVIKAQRHRTQDRNREDALARLQAMVDEAAVPPVPRIATRPTKGAKRRRLETKVRRGQVKAARARILPDASS